MKTNELLSIAAQEYHTAPGVSASMLEKIRISPAHLRAYMDGELEDESPALSLGTLCHRAIFEPDTLTADSVVMRPETIRIDRDRAKALKSAVVVKEDGDKTEIQWNPAISECKSWAKEQTLPIVDAREWKKAVRIRDNAHADRTVRELLSGGHPEQALFVEDGEGTLRKSKFDYISMSGNTIPDLKTCRIGHPDKFERTILDRGYHIRAAYYLDNAELAGIKKDTFIFICIETAPPYLVTLYYLGDRDIEWGRSIYKANLQTYRNCIESGRWGGYHIGIKEIGIPAWAARQLEEVA